MCWFKHHQTKRKKEQRDACINNQRDSFVSQAVAQKPIVLSTKQLFRERCSNLCVLINLDGKHFGEKRENAIYKLKSQNFTNSISIHVK